MTDKLTATTDPDHPAGSGSAAGVEPVLLVNDADGVRTLTLNRPGAFNAFDLELKSQFLPALRAAAADDSVRVVVICGNGRAFSAGQDLKEHLTLTAAGDPAVARTVPDFYNPMIEAVISMRKPVIAAVNGVAAGAGAALCFACDLRIAAESATFTMAFAGVGLSADSGASATLPRLIGLGRATQLMFSGEKVSAAEALRIGMVTAVVPDANFAATVATTAGQLAAGATASYGWIKASLQVGVTSDLSATLAFEEQAQRACFASADHHEGMQAFVEKRRPQFQGR